MRPTSQTTATENAPLHSEPEQFTNTLFPEQKSVPEQIASNQNNEFDYKPIPLLAPLALGMGILSIFAIWAEIGVVICLLGMIIGFIARRIIRKADGAYSGILIANLGLLLSTVFLISGITTHVHAYMTELPEGHQRVHFSAEISQKQFVEKNGQREIHPDVKPFIGQKIFIKGYMWNTRVQTGLSEFFLLKDNGKCCFGGKAKPYDVIHIKLQDGVTVNKSDGLVAVAGILECHPPGKATGKLDIVYTIKATQAGPALTTH